MGPQDFAQWKRPGTQIKPLSFKVGKTVALGTGGMLLGEVTIVGCFLLAHVRDGHSEDLKPYSFRIRSDRAPTAITSMIGL